jgi:CMP/dCMP kinase
MTNDHVPVISIDGPSASGKGTVAQRVAGILGFHYLDSGAFYRLVALVALQSKNQHADEKILSDIAKNLDVTFENGRVLLEGRDVTDAIRSEEVGNMAAKISAYPLVRTALLERQRVFRQPPGLVADGRDMGSVVFPAAILKIFLTASAETRAQRRYKQLMEKGIDANISTLLCDIRARDARDSTRSVAPLQHVAGANMLDTTSLTIEESVERVLKQYDEVR